MDNDLEAAYAVIDIAEEKIQLKEYHKAGKILLEVDNILNKYTGPDKATSIGKLICITSTRLGYIFSKYEDDKVVRYTKLYYILSKSVHILSRAILS